MPVRGWSLPSTATSLRGPLDHFPRKKWDAYSGPSRTPPTPDVWGRRKRSVTIYLRYRLVQPVVPPEQLLPHGDGRHAEYPKLVRSIGRLP
jgi:hypothetical protein